MCTWHSAQLFWDICFNHEIQYYNSAYWEKKVHWQNKLKRFKFFFIPDIDIVSFFFFLKKKQYVVDMLHIKMTAVGRSVWENPA